MEGSQAGLCAPALITVVLFLIVKHGCRYAVVAYSDLLVVDPVCWEIG
jgi:hypothetical protein